MSRVLVTGGAGFIGSHVVDLLVIGGSDVTVLDGLDPAAHGQRPSYLREGVRYVFEDVRDEASVARALRGCDAVIHLAGKVGLGVDLADVPDYVSRNLVGTAALIEGMRTSGFEGPSVLASSMVVYGEGRYACPTHGQVAPLPRDLTALEAGRFEPPCPECGSPLDPRPVPESAPMDPRNVYAATKVHQEHLFQAWRRETGLPVSAMRYHNVYGARMPRDTPYAGVASIFRSSLERGDAPRVFEDGGQRRDFVHVDDVARATIRPLSDASMQGAFNVGSGDPHTVGEMAAALAAALDGTEPEVTGVFRLGDVRHVFASVDRLLAAGWRPAVPFDEGMRRFATDPLRASVSPEGRHAP
jgi:dTDP-L-rhamnose 4-epimerase